MSGKPYHRDGNAAAGPLADLLGFDVTAAAGQCAGCSSQMALGQALLYSGGPGLVLRCPQCDHVLLRMAQSVTHAWLDTSGLASMRLELASAIA
jgi:hypothetical protein